MAPQKLFQSCSSHSLSLSFSFSLFLPPCGGMSVDASFVHCQFKIVVHGMFLHTSHANRLFEGTPCSSALTYTVHTHPSEHTRTCNKTCECTPANSFIPSPPLALLRTEPCHLFKCSLIVWPQGSLKHTHCKSLHVSSTVCLCLSHFLFLAFPSLPKGKVDAVLKIIFYNLYLVFL